MALFMGICFVLMIGNPYAQFSQDTSKWLLKLAVIGLGFSVDIYQVIEVGRSSIVLTLVSITAILGLGQILSQLFKVKQNTGLLISFGTAICGGSAIAAMAPVIKAKQEEIAAALAVVFILNGVALFIFPVIGHYFALNEREFAIWAALAIHDTSSVVATSAAFGATAVTIATTIKLARAMWIIPYTLIAGVFWKSDEKASIPIFIVGFIIAALIKSSFPQYEGVWSSLTEIAKQLLVVCLFLIGSGLSTMALKKVGLRPFLMAFVLWLIVCAVILLLILDGIII